MHKQKYFGVTPRPGCPPCILPNSVEKRVIAELIEQGLGFFWSTMMVNTYQLKEGLRTVGRSTVMFAFRRMKPIITRVQKRSQGNKGNQNW